MFGLFKVDSKNIINPAVGKEQTAKGEVLYEGGQMNNPLRRKRYNSFFMAQRYKKMLKAQQLSAFILVKTP